MNLLNSAWQYIDGLFSWSSARAAVAFIIAVASSLYSTAAGFTHPSIPFLLALVTIDFILAAGIAIAQDCFTWPGFRHGLAKFLAYALIFIVTSLADKGIGISGWAFNLTVMVSAYAIAGESISCLKHIDRIFPGRLPLWIITRLETFRASIECDTAPARRKDDWRGKRPDSEREAAPAGMAAKAARATDDEGI